MFDKGFMVVDILGMFNTNTGCNSESYYICLLYTSDAADD